MSAWRAGREAARGVTINATDRPWKQYVDRLVKYIPGDAIGAFTAVITGFLAKDGSIEPKLWLAILFAFVSPGLVVAGWWATQPRGAFGQIRPDIVLAAIGFVAWSLTVPGNGWTEIKIVHDQPGVVGVIGVLVGLFLPLLARGWGR